MGNEAGGLSQVLKSSVLMQDLSSFNARPGDCCRLTSVVLQEGTELQLWEASFDSPLQVDIVEDNDFVHFTYVIQGGAQMETLSQRFGQQLEVLPGSGVLHSCPGEKGRFRQAGQYSSVVAMVRPNVFLGWDEVATTCLKEVMSRGQCLVEGIKGRELQNQAWRLQRALNVISLSSDLRQEPCRDLHLQIHGLSFIAAFLEAVTQDMEQRPCLSREDRQRLTIARELLLSDLSRAPRLPELAKASGLGLSKLKRGFQALFGDSVYALFMHERMLEAKRRLQRGGSSVTEIAVDLGYTNVSHFAAAFRKQHGVTPAAIGKLKS